MHESDEMNGKIITQIEELQFQKSEYTGNLAHLERQAAQYFELIEILGEKLGLTTEEALQVGPEDLSISFAPASDYRDSAKKLGMQPEQKVFEIDSNGMLNVGAEDKGTGKSEKITITNDN